MKLFEKISAPLLFFFLAAFSLYLCVFKPYHNWDMIAYIAVAKSFEQPDFNALQTFAYQQARNAVSAEEYEQLAQENSNGYRHSISTDASAFKEQLPNYGTRLIYTGLIYLLYKTGINIAFATHLISGLAVAAAIAFLYFISASFLAKPFVYAVPLLAIIFGILDLAALSTPDGLAFLAVIVAVYLYLNARIGMLLVFLPLIIGVRTDLVLFTTPLLFFIFLSDEKNRLKTALAAAVSVIIYFGIGAYCGYVGWSVIFYHSLVQLSIHPISEPPTLTARQYLSALRGGTRILLVNKAFLLYLLLTAYSLYFIYLRAKISSLTEALTARAAVLVFVCLVFVGSHFAAFPADWDRFFSAAYLVTSLGLLILITDYIKKLIISGGKPR